MPLEYINIDSHYNWYLEALEVPSPASLTFFGRLCIGERRRAFELLHTPKLTCFVVVVSSSFALHICRCLELVNYNADQRWGPGRAYHSNTNQPYSIMLWSLAFEIWFISLQTWKEGKESMLIANSTEEPIQPFVSKRDRRSSGQVVKARWLVLTHHSKPGPLWQSCSQKWFSSSPPPRQANRWDLWARD